MLDFDAARNSVVRKWLPALAEDLCTPAVLIEDQTEEHEWGWLFRWKPLDPSAVPPEEASWGFSPIIVDRVTGNAHHVGTVGTRAAVLRLLWDRERLIAEQQVKPEPAPEGEGAPG